VRGRALRDFGGADRDRSLPLRSLPAAVRQRILSTIIINRSAIEIGAKQPSSTMSVRSACTSRADIPLITGRGWL
jgi:hypothetical protein